MRRSGRSSPSSSRIGRLSHASLRGCGGQVPSFNPPSTSAVAAGEPRLERPENAHPHARQPGPPHHPVRDGGAEHVGIIAGRDREIGIRQPGRDVVEDLAERVAVRAREGGRRVAFARERRDDLAVARRDCAERMRAAPDAFERRQRGREPRDQIGRRPPDRGRSSRRADRSGADRSARRARAWRARPARLASARARPALPGRGRGPRRIARSSTAMAWRCAPCRRAEPRQRMLEQRQQADRRQSLDGGLRGQPREQTGRRVGERIAAGIVDRDVPARQRRQHPAGERAVGRDQRGGLVGLLERLAQRERDRQRFLLGIGGFDDRKPGERRLRMRHEIARRRCGRATGRWRRPAGTLPRPAARGRSRPVARAAAPRRGRCRNASAKPAGRIADGRRPGRRTLTLPGLRRGREGAAIRRQVSSSRSVSSPGSTTAPPGSCATAAIRAAVAGIEPVEPAAITGPGIAREPRRLGLDQRIAPHRRSRSCRARRASPARRCGRS